MGNRRGSWLGVTLALVVALVAGSVEPAAAKKPKVTVSIDGKRYKFKGRYVVASTSGSGTIVVATKAARPGKILRAVGFGCAYYLPNETFPLVADPQYCNATLTEQRVGGSFAIKGWIALNGVQVTYESFDGTWATGTVSGTLDPVPGTGAELPVVYEGTFKVRITGGE